MTQREQLRQQIVEFLNTVARPGCRVDGLADDTNLLDAGIVDSFALIQIISYLENDHDLRLHSLGIDPADLSTLNGIISAIEQSAE
jgi:acyl carrier protein